MPKCPKDCKKHNPFIFRRVVIPAVVDDDTINPPANGAYCNAVVVYEATGNVYLYSSDGIPTSLSSTDYNLLSNLPSINGKVLRGDVTLSDLGISQLIEEEAELRATADEILQRQIDAITVASDVVDIVGTYEELEEYDTSKLNENDIIKVLSDETIGGATAYYRWVNGAWQYIGQEGPYYTKSQTDALLDQKMDVGALDDYYTKTETNTLLATKASVSDLANKQDVLIAGSNITIDPTTNVISAVVPSLTNYYTKSETYNQTEVDNLIDGVEADIPTKTSDLLNDSGFLTSIPIASSSALGGIKVGSGLSIAQDGTLSATGTSITVDSALSTTSTNPVENRVITNALNNKANISDIPTVPTNVSAFYNDAGYLTSTDVANNYYNKTETYTQAQVNALIPTKTSDLTNDGANGTSTYVETSSLATVATSGSYNDLTNKPTVMSGLVEMSYGESDAWAKFIAAYQAKQIVYCRASSNSNPASGSQTRKAFMAYVNNADNPTEVEFQYVRSVSSKTSSQPVDQVFVYKLTSASGGTWTVQTRDMAPKLAQGTNTTVSYSNGTYTISATQPTVNNATLTIQQNGTNVQTFTANQATNATANITVPTKTSDLANDSNFVASSDLATVATSGSYNDLSDKPTIPAAQVQSDWTQATTTAVDYIKNKPTLATVATSGSYNDLNDKPTIPTVNNATLTIQKNSTDIATFTANASSNVTANISVPTKTSDLVNDGSDNTAQYLETDETAYKTASIPYGVCDGTSTSTVYTATVPGITELRDGVCMWLKNGVVTSASGFTIDINGLGAKPVYSNMAAATRDTTIWNVNYTMFFVYDSTRVEGGCWILYRGYNSDTNTIGYQLRTNSQTLPMTSVVYRYRLLFTSADGEHYVPATNSTSTNATSSRTVCQDPINPFGHIVYYGTTASVAADSRPAATSLWGQYAISLGYSFNRTGAALTLTSWKPVYMKAAPQSDGSAIIDETTPYVQDLPTTEDGKIYIFLGIAYSATNIELQLTHPVYWYKDGMIRPYTNAAVNDATLTIQQNGTDVQTFTANQATNATANITVPTKTSDLTNDSGYVVDDGDIICTDTEDGFAQIVNPTSHNVAPLSLTKLYGDAEQETTTGKNLASIETSATKTIGGVAFTIVDGVLNISSGTTAGYTNFYFDSFQVPNSGASVLWLEVSGYTPAPSDNCVLMLQESADNSTWTNKAQQSWGSPTTQAITLDNTKYYRIRIYAPPSVVFSNAKAKFQLEYGSTKTDFEPYTGGSPMPNPDFPSSVNVVSGLQTVQIVGKNFFDFGRFISENVSNPIVGIQRGTATWTSDSITITATANDAYTKYDFAKSLYPCIHVQKNTDYVLSWKSSTPYEQTVKGLVYIFGKNALGGADIIINAQDRVGRCQFNSGNYDTITFRLGVNTSGDSITYSDIQLELGNQATDYEPYQGQSFEINLGKNLLPITDGTFTSSGLTYTVNNGSISIGGTSTAVSALNFTQTFPVKLKAGQTYTLSANNSVGSSDVILRLMDGNGNPLSGSALTITSANAKINITPSTDTTELRGQLRINANVTFNDFMVKPMLELGSQATSFSPYKTPIELAGIGTYTDGIWNDDGTWKVHKEVGKVDLGTLAWVSESEYGAGQFRANMTAAYVSDIPVCQGRILCSHFTWQPSANYNTMQEGHIAVTNSQVTPILRTRSSVYSSMTANDFKTAMSGTYLYYQIYGTPTDTEITDTDLLAQLNTISELYQGVNNLMLIPSGGAQGETTLCASLSQLPVATTQRLGAVIVGDGLKISENGKLSISDETYNRFVPKDDLWRITYPFLLTNSKIEISGDSLYYITGNNGMQTGWGFKSASDFALNEGMRCTVTTNGPASSSDAHYNSDMGLAIHTSYGTYVRKPIYKKFPYSSWSPAPTLKYSDIPNATNAYTLLDLVYVKNSYYDGWVVTNL